ncbi:MAG: hypothetical protein JNK82_43670 [Myxococcaceae bacterium]|nr:hypothetical protein [Myxococcaceae bacterium]
MVSPSLAIGSNGAGLLITDGGAYTYLPDYGTGACFGGALVNAEPWLLCDNGVLRFGATPQLLAAPTTGSQFNTSLMASSDGTGWLLAGSVPYRRQSGGWVAIPQLPACQGLSQFQPIGSTEGLFSCAVFTGGEQAAVVHRVSMSSAPQLLVVIDGGAMLSARSTDPVFVADPPGNSTHALLDLDDGGLSAAALPVSGLVKFSSDSQAYIAGAELYRFELGSWVRVPSVQGEAQYDLRGSSGVRVRGGALTLFNATVSSRLSTSVVPEALLSPYSLPELFTGPLPTPRVRYGQAVFEVGSGGELTPAFTLPSSFGRVAGRRDGGVAQLDATRLQRLIGGTYFTTNLPVGNPNTVFPAAAGRWVVGADNALVLVEADGGARRIDVLDGGNQRQQLVSPTELVVRGGNTLAQQRAVLIDLVDLGTQVVPLPPGEFSYGLCRMGGRWFVGVDNGVRVSTDAGWQLLPGPWSIDLTCWENRGQLFVSQAGRLYDVTSGAWLPARSPTRGLGFVAEDVRLWVTGSGGTVVVRP